MKIEFEITGKKLYLIYLANTYTTHVLFKYLINVSKGNEMKFDHYQKKAPCYHFLLSKILHKTILNDIHQVLQFVLFENQITSAQNCKIISVVVFKKYLLLICFLIIL